MKHGIGNEPHAHFFYLTYILVGHIHIVHILLLGFLLIVGIPPRCLVLGILALTWCFLVLGLECKG
jgi:hypothetical protein